MDAILNAKIIKKGGNSMETIKVYLDDHEKSGRKVVEVELVERRATNVLVKLADGNIIKRKNKDIVTE
jgi:hypothetical protein